MKFPSGKHLRLEQSRFPIGCSADNYNCGTATDVLAKAGIARLAQHHGRDRPETSLARAACTAIQSCWIANSRSPEILPDISRPCRHELPGKSTDSASESAAIGDHGAAGLQDASLLATRLRMRDE